MFVNIHFPFLSSLQDLNITNPLLSFFQFHALIFKIIYIYIPVESESDECYCTFMISGLTVWYWISEWWAFLCGRLFPSLLASPSGSSSLFSTEAF